MEHAARIGAHDQIPIGIRAVGDGLLDLHARVVDEDVDGAGCSGERLHRAYVFNPPKFFVCFWNLIHRFVDPVTKDKIQFCTGTEGLKKIEQDIDLSNVEEFVGGTGRVHQFDSEEYLLKYPHSSTFGEDPSLWRRAVKECEGNVAGSGVDLDSVGEEKKEVFTRGRLERR